MKSLWNSLELDPSREPLAGSEAPREVPWQSRYVDFNDQFLITEKIDGSRVGLHITRAAPESLAASPGHHVEVEGQSWLLQPMSPHRWLTRERDNFGFAAWAHASATQLVRLGTGRHFGVWYGQGITRTYGLDHRRLALFDAERWSHLPGLLSEQVETVPLIARARGPELSAAVEGALHQLEHSGSLAVPGQPAAGIEIAPQALEAVRFKATLNP
ncbi:RNA ligase family protein [Glycomyces sp. TRM65418]|uniref:RNA ligase family protein n=1 Tax=Glycomyces sp. TRM65418 TaxID=2867006 RepID=UPI001CE6776A|nr:RNA ligase family protein [Glycomyces sp. TRM65418]MCC3762643.1 RNA ligase family protein [Glycomyces sp. TRM65418]QZD56680.1 RNA ligase family protein [Glycomyces sp. TRM65418]